MYMDALMNAEKIGLCRGRHEIPGVEKYIFPETVNPLDTEGLEREAETALNAVRGDAVDLYVTGLTVALIAALNAAKSLGIEVRLMHFDRETGGYFPQSVK
jgi:hypothetical protein